jgi:hypothetical protein
MQHGSHYRRVHPAGETQNYLFIPYLLLYALDALFYDAGWIP